MKTQFNGWWEIKPKTIKDIKEITPENLIIPGDKLDISKILRKDIK